MTERSHPVRLAGSELGQSRHVCAFFHSAFFHSAFFHSKEEEYRVLMPFIKEGFEAGDKAFHILDPDYRLEHQRRLEEAGIDVAAAEDRGQLEVLGWQDAYLRDGRFDQDRMLLLIEAVLREGKAQGFSMLRLVANMEWGLGDQPGVEDIVKYESRLNYVLPKYDDAVV